MRQHTRFVGVLGALFLAASHIAAQDAGGLELAVPARPGSGGFMAVVLSSGVVGLLNWAGIFFWGILALPLGIVSVVHCATCRTSRFPLATKLLAIGAVWLSVLGWLGAAQGTISAFSYVSMGSPDVALLALNIAQAVYSIAGALGVCQCYLLFILTSVVVAHFRHRRTMTDSQQAP